MPEFSLDLGDCMGERRRAYDTNGCILALDGKNEYILCNILSSKIAAAKFSVWLTDMHKTASSLTSNVEL